MKRFITVFSGLALLITLLATAVTPGLAAVPAFNKANFNHPLTISNRYFPLVVGTTFIYRGTEDGEPTYETVAVTNSTRTIMGIQARVVHDTVKTSGVVSEVTDDWYAQDNSGNVWYMGENSAQYDPDGSVAGHEGSWKAGVNGALPGIVMEVKPIKGDTFSQEYLKGIAEDKSTVLSVTAKICIPLGCYTPTLETKDFSPLEPGVVEHKYFKAGIGQIETIVVAGGQEESHLVKITQK